MNNCRQCGIRAPQLPFGLCPKCYTAKYPKPAEVRVKCVPIVSNLAATNICSLCDQLKECPFTTDRNQDQEELPLCRDCFEATGK
jgi:hypothetical protein